MKINRLLLISILALGAFIIALSLNYPAFEEGYESYVTPYIWQTYKTKNLPEQAEAARETWISNNPDWKCELYDDSDIEKYIKSYWSSKMYKFFKALPVGVMKADLWRYLILKTHGGVYSDIDSECLKPIVKWEEEQKFDSKNILLIGLENDEHFCQWTIYSTKEHPVMKYVCDYILNNYEENGIDTKNKDFVHKTTGPAIWTAAIIDYLEYEGLTTAKGALEIFKDYKKNPGKFHEYGIYLLSKDYYEKIYSKNLYGSQNFGDGYVKWIDEAKDITGESIHS
jgi:mannosyltransferase OCH1-like enzyme